MLDDKGHDETKFLAPYGVTAGKTHADIMLKNTRRMGRDISHVFKEYHY